MSDYDNNVYYNPAKHGLEIVALIDYSDGNYQFDYRVVWLHKETGVLYTARDSGCSCPSPFEDYNGIQELDRFDKDEIKAEVRAVLSDLDRGYRGENSDGFLKDINKL